MTENHIVIGRISKYADWAATWTEPDTQEVFIGYGGTIHHALTELDVVIKRACLPNDYYN